MEKVDISFLKAIMKGETPNMNGLSTEAQSVLSQMIEMRSDCKRRSEDFEDLNRRLEELLEVLVEFARFNFSMEIPISDKADELDGIALGLQTLGQEIEFYQKELQLSNQNLLQAQEMAKIGSWSYDSRTLETYWSDEMYRIFDLEKEVDSPDNYTSRFSSEDAEKIERLNERAIHYHEPYQVQMRIIVNGNIKYIEASAQPVFEEDELVKVVGTVMDVTERTIAHRKLEVLNRELEEKVAERTKDLEGFSYSVSHDLRAPLRSIIGFSNILLETQTGKLDEEAQRLIDIIVRNAQKMSNLIEELLTFSRVGVTMPHFHPIDLNDMLEHTWSEALSSFTQVGKVRLEKDNFPTIFGTASMLSLVFENIFSNALKYSSNNEEILIRIVRHESDNESLTLKVVDNGCGFNMKYHDKLFGVFQRLHSEDEFPGTGVGLALVKRIVDKHNGKIWAESEVGQGASFFIKLPTVDPMKDV